MVKAKTPDISEKPELEKDWVNKVVYRPFLLAKDVSNIKIADRENYWTPEVHVYGAELYLIASFKAPNRCPVGECDERCGCCKELFGKVTDGPYIFKDNNILKITWSSHCRILCISLSADFVPAWDTVAQSISNLFKKMLNSLELLGRG